MSDAIVKNLSFGDDARTQIFRGIEKLANAVSSTLGASGKCVILEDAQGKPVITKDGVTVADSIYLRDSVENIGATLLKEAARKTVKEAGDGTTTATILAHAIISEAYKVDTKDTRAVKEQILKGVDKVIKNLEKQSTPVKNKIDDIAVISTNNDKALGSIIAEAFKTVGDGGLVVMEPSASGDTKVEVVEGVEYNKGLLNPNFITNKETGTAELESPLVLIMDSKIDSIRQIQPVLEYVIKEKQPLLIIGEVEETVVSALLMNKVKGNIKINVLDPPAYGLRRKEILDDLALLTGATVVNEDLGDDLNSIEVDYLGQCVKVVTEKDRSVIRVNEPSEEVEGLIAQTRVNLMGDNKEHERIGLEQRLARLSAKVAVIKVGANSAIELKEKQDRVEDAICATRAAIKEGIVPGGGIALLNSCKILNKDIVGENILQEAIKAPFKTILQNAGLKVEEPTRKGVGVNVVTGNMVNMFKAGIIDPLLVTKSALRNAASVATTILSTDCVINNIRIDESGR
jgi:chaperonin GroEL|tara:strand:+ start:1057 stop:2604 length:1548 start_codon:yes stop_codon:yes gene_type:complete